MRRAREEPSRREERFDAGRVGIARRSKLAPRAVLRFLVVAEADQLRPVAEAAALHLVVAHLDDELLPDGRLLEVAGAPAVRFREAPLGGILEQRHDPCRDLVLLARCDGARADVVDAAVV